MYKLLKNLRRKTEIISREALKLTEIDLEM